MSDPVNVIRPDEQRALVPVTDRSRMMIRRKTTSESPVRGPKELPCRSCGGVLMVFAGDYVTWDRCVSCGRSEVIGWVSCQPGTLRPGLEPALGWGTVR
jgi:hypothetical protein